MVEKADFQFTQWDDPLSVINTSAGPKSYREWCASEVARLARKGVKSVVAEEDNRCCVVIRDNIFYGKVTKIEEEESDEHTI